MFNKSISPWVQTNGPLILLPDYLLNDWQGINKANTQLISDYERSCSIDNYLGYLYVRDSQVIIFGDEPMQTAWVSNVGFPGGCFVRWGYASDYQTVAKHCMQLDYKLLPQPENFILAVKKKIFLFDAAYPGEEVRDFPERVLEIPLNESGKYGIGTYHFKPDESTWLILHKVEKLSYRFSRGLPIDR